MSRQSAPVNAESLDLSDILPFADFRRECEKLKLATSAQLQWWPRYRHKNGLIASGAIVERRINPRSKKAMLFAVRPRFVSWLARANTVEVAQ